MWNHGGQPALVAMVTNHEIDRQAHLWSLGIGLAGAALLLAAAAAAASERSRAARETRS
jgi:hypothetical protein